VANYNFSKNETGHAVYSVEDEYLTTNSRENDFLFCEHTSYYNFMLQDEVQSLKIKLAEKNETFSQCVLRIIAEKQLTETSVYKNAYLDRKLFSKLRNDPNYQPSRNTALALGIALELDIDGMNDLLQKAGFHLSDTLPFDLVIRHCIERGIYSILAINEILFTLDLPLL